MAEIPLCYPKIPHLAHLKAKKRAPVEGKAMAFRKYDGTNIHICVRKGQVKGFGTRRNRFDFAPEGIAEFHAHTRNTLKHVPDLIGEITSKLTLDPAAEMTLFTEYHHRSSFAGLHPTCADPSDFRLTLFDINAGADSPYSYRILPPTAFLEAAEKMGWEDVAEILWEGSFRSKRYTEFLHSVTENLESGFEGAVVKPLQGGDRFKIKSDRWTANYNAWMNP